MTTTNLIKLQEIIKEKKGRSLDPRELFQVLKMNSLYLMCWGARNFKSFGNDAFLFTVSGHLHTGYVLITLGFNDTFTVTLLNNRMSVKESVDDVYVDVLSDTIDSLVETK